MEKKKKIIHLSIKYKTLKTRCNSSKESKTRLASFVYQK